MTCVLTRTCHDAEMGTFGRLKTPGGFECVTIERPWLENEPYVSCVPAGIYPLRKSMFHKGKPTPYMTFELRDVPGRSAIKIHKAVLSRHVQGCIGVGLYTGCYKGRWGILGNSDALEGLLEALGVGDEDNGEKFIEIKWAGSPEGGKD